MMNEIDKKIIGYLLDHESATTTELAKFCFEIDSRKELISKDSLIRYHVSQFVEDNIIYKNGGKKAVYSINKENVFAGNSSLLMDSDDEKEPMNIDLGFVLVIYSNDRKSMNLIIFEK